MPVTLQALLFDVDGTLAETEGRGHRVSYNRAFRDMGLKFRWSPELYRQLLDTPGGRERLLFYRERYKPDLGIYAQLQPAAWAEAVHRLKSRHFRRLVMSGAVPARPGILRIFDEAHAAGIRLAIVTNACNASVTPVLRHALGMERLSQVEVIVSAEHVKRKKPHPEPYLHALEQMKLTASECMAVEDSAQGLRAAMAAGLATLIVQNEDTVGQDFSGAAAVVECLGEPGNRPPVLAGTVSEEYVCLATFERLLAETGPIIPAAVPKDSILSVVASRGLSLIRHSRAA